ncbi:terminase small subunit [Paenibacillus sp. FSL H3-0333]|uniref:terminase small subunit n=1 Tax=Paenibacillus sp. FSL H3-0333 TaxID=2921373 RepID=UPI0030F7E35A
MALTAKQQRFIDEYMIDFNATQAAIRAGYSKKTAYSIGNENLSKPEIAGAIKLRQDEIGKKNDITAEWIVEQMKEVYNLAIESKKLSDANKSLEMLGRTKGIFNDKLNLSGGLNNEVEITIGVDKYDT